MAKIIDDIRLRRLFSIRDKAANKMEFNSSYIDIAESFMREKLDEKLEYKKLKSEKKLSKYEKHSLSEKELYKKQYEKELSELNQKQRLPYLAIEQNYLRMKQNKDADDAELYKSEAIEKLNAKENELIKSWEAKISAASCDVNEESVIKLKEEKEKLDSKINLYKEISETKIATKLKKLKLKKDKSDCVLNKKIESSMEQIKALGGLMQDAVKHENSVLEVNELEMRFGGVKAVDKLSFTVKEGEIFGLIGPNGAGKTTVFNCITQFNKPTGGTIYYRRKSGEVVDMCSRKVHDVIPLGIVRTFQNVELIWELSVLENLLIGAHSLYHSKFFDHLIHTGKLIREERVIRAKALKILELLNLTAYKDVVPMGLPYGILKKIELARTLMVNPRLIILDEPAAGLNEAETEELSAILEKIRKDYSCTIFLVEHDMGLVMNICDTICAISFGKKLAMGTPNDIQTNPVVQEAYLGGTMEDM